MEMNQQDSPVLVGLSDIAAYIKRSKPIVRRMIRNREIPVRLIHGAYMTTTEALDDWLRQEVNTNQKENCMN